MMTQEELEALLGRTLTAREVDNLDLYLNIALENLEELLCLSLDEQNSSGDEPEFEERTFKTREGYSTLFTGMFTEIESVTVDGNETTDYTPYFFDNPNKDYFNSIVFDTAFNRKVTVVINAAWGFLELPDDLQLLLAQLFAITSKKYSTGSVKSKKVEDFSITYGDATDGQVFADQNALTIQKYSLCNVVYVLHGDVCKIHRSRYCGCV